jgi:hypothetical protein
MAYRAAYGLEPTAELAVRYVRSGVRTPSEFQAPDRFAQALADAERSAVSEERSAALAEAWDAGVAAERRFQASQQRLGVGHVERPDNPHRKDPNV